MPASASAPAELDAALAAARVGDGAAFARLVRWCEAEAFRIAASHTQDDDLAADMWQDALLSAWSRLPSFQGGAQAFRAWLMTILVNRCRNQVSYDRRHRPDEPQPGGSGVCESEQPTDRLHLIVDREKSADELLEDEAYAELLRAAVAAVDEPLRTVLRLHCSDLKYAEIAAITQSTTSTVGTRLLRARRAAQAYVERVLARRPELAVGQTPPPTGRRAVTP